MNRSSLPPRGRARVRHGAFTLIELLTVIAIILVLAGLLLHIAGSANYKSSLARAQAEIQAMSTAAESYKADNGTYPRPTAAGSGSDYLNAQSQTDNDPGGTDKSYYQAASEMLYQALSGITSTAGANVTYGGKRYMEFKPGQLSDATSGAYTVPSATTIIADPFGLTYGYSTAAAYASDQAQTSGQPVDITKGYNPTFDLWSTAGYGTGGKAYSSTSLAPSAYNTVWVKNW